MLQKHRALALERDENDETALHVLARKTLDFNGTEHQNPLALIQLRNK